ncbi:serine hydrolase domain-containing protein [uncultured Algibacter sp.]|uniref:serine hydrolase domain-containing protein n=1 Tax=uncultured Algibacter sp. TaxID=298659 RepID=UPI002631F3E7|nr:serine hydrolase domain-containing protein [uncultured Algibacter sp.]
MKKTHLITIIMFSATTMFAQNISKKIDSILNNLHEEHPNTGISLGLYYKDQVIYSNIGTINRTDNQKIDENTVFEIASITKAITGNLIAQAIKDKKFNSNSYIDNYLPPFFELNTNIKNKIKISDLASHQSGLPDIDFRKLIALNPQQPVSVINKDSVANLINNCDTLIDYGKYRYSTIGFILLGQILEQAYGESYEFILTEKIIKPIQMKRTFTRNFDVENVTSGFNLDGGAQELFKWNITAPAGLIKSSSADMISYLKHLLYDDSNRSATSITEQRFYKDDKIEIGLGLNIIQIGDETIFAKTGDTLGQTSVIAYNQAKKWGLVILINESNSKLRNNIFNTIYEQILN